MRVSSAAYLFRQGVRNVWNNRVMSFASFCILTVSLLLVGFSAIFTVNINSVISDIEGKNEVIIFLSEDADDEYIKELGQKLESTDNISGVDFYSKEQALEDMKDDMTDAEDIFSYLGSDNPLPDSFRIKITDISKMSSTLMSINNFEYIEKVKAPYDFVNILTGLRNIITTVCVITFAALVTVSFIIISNTTRASIDIRRNEISIMRLVGATNTFIKIPFFIEGMVMGIMAGAVASVLVLLCYDGLVDLLATETTLFSAIGISGFIPIERFIWKVSVGFVGVGALVSSMVTVFLTNKYVKV